MDLKGVPVEYGEMSFLALIGSVARGKKWLGDGGKFSFTVFLSQAATAIGLAVFAVWLGDDWHVEPAAIAAISVGLGWLGPDTVSGFVLQRMGLGK